MALHDAWARRTPFELALPSTEFAEERFGQIVAEADEQGFADNLREPAAFALRGEVGAILQEIRTEDAPAARIGQHAVLLYHAFWFWRRGTPLHVVRVDAARAVVEDGVGEGALQGEAGAVYLQLPQHLFWVPGDPAPDSLDGLFLTWSDGVLHTLAIAGIARRAEGLVVLELPAVPIAALPALRQETMREDGTDFSTTLPGADVDRLYGVESAGELLRLVAGLAGGLFRGDEQDPAAAAEAGPEPSTLRYRVVDRPALEGPPAA